MCRARCVQTVTGRRRVYPYLHLRPGSSYPPSPGDGQQEGLAAVDATGGLEHHRGHRSAVIGPHLPRAVLRGRAHAVRAVQVRGRVRRARGRRLVCSGCGVTGQPPPEVSAQAVRHPLHCQRQHRRRRHCNQLLVRDIREPWVCVVQTPFVGIQKKKPFRGGVSTRQLHSVSATFRVAPPRQWTMFNSMVVLLVDWLVSAAHPHCGSTSRKRRRLSYGRCLTRAA